MGAPPELRREVTAQKAYLDVIHERWVEPDRWTDVVATHHRPAALAGALPAAPRVVSAAADGRSSQIARSAHAAEVRRRVERTWEAGLAPSADSGLAGSSGPHGKAPA